MSFGSVLVELDEIEVTTGIARHVKERVQWLVMLVTEPPFWQRGFSSVCLKTDHFWFASTNWVTKNRSVLMKLSKDYKYTGGLRNEGELGTLGTKALERVCWSSVVESTRSYYIQCHSA